MTSRGGGDWGTDEHTATSSFCTSVVVSWEKSDAVMASPLEAKALRNDWFTWDPTPTVNSNVPAAFSASAYKKIY